jgi:hypothetical protein
MVENAYEPPDTDEEDDEGSGSGGSGTSGSSRKGEPGVSGPGNDPQAQAITDSSGTMPQVRKDHVEVSFADIDDGSGELSACPDGHVLRALRSRGGIMLDTAAVPPVLTPLVLADSARIAPEPSAMA